MKILNKQYAQALLDLTEGEGKKEIAKTIAEFVRVLALNNSLTRAQEIIDEFEKLADVKENMIRAKVTSAKELEDNSLNLISDYIKHITDAEKVIMDKEIKKELIGGLVIKYQDKVLDLSLQNRIRELKDKMIK